MRGNKAKSFKTSILDASEAFPLNSEDQGTTTEEVSIPTGDSEKFEDAQGSPPAKKELFPV